MTCPPELPIQGSEDKVVQQLRLRNVWNPCGAKVSVKKKAISVRIMCSGQPLARMSDPDRESSGAGGNLFTECDGQNTVGERLKRMARRG